MSRRPNYKEVRIIIPPFNNESPSRFTHNLKVLQVAHIGRDELKVIVAEVQRPQRLHHEEVARQLLLVEVVVRQVEHLQHRERTESSGQRVQPIDGDIEDPQLRHRRQRDGQFLQMVVGQVQDLQIQQIGYSCGQLKDPIMAQRKPRHKRHVHWQKRSDGVIGLCYFQFYSKYGH